MKFDKYHYPVFAGDAGGGDSSPAAPPAAPPSNPTDPNPEAISQEDSWLLGQFDAMRADDASEDIDMVEPAAPAPIPVSPQGENPEGVSPPSPQMGNGQEPLRAVATPLPVVSAPTPPVPAVGVSGNQPAVGGTSAPTPPLDPTSIMSQLAAGMLAQREGLITELAKRYQMSEADADKLGFTPEQAAYFARVKAEAQFEAVSSLTHMQAEQLPVYFNGLQEARSANQRKEDEFFGEFPELRQAPKDQLGRIFQAVSTIHPNLKGAEWRKKAGEMALTSLEIQRQPRANGSAAPAQQVRTPGPIVRSSNGLPHLPAGTSTTPAAPGQQMTEAERFFRLLQQTDAGDFET